jgi:hypothetical protein
VLIGDGALGVITGIVDRLRMRFCFLEWTIALMMVFRRVCVNLMMRVMMVIDMFGDFLYVVKLEEHSCQEVIQVVHREDSGELNCMQIWIE